MKFSLEHLRAFAAGVDRVEPLDDGVWLPRFPKKLYALYADNPGVRARADSSTCVRLRFQTDSRWIRIALRYREPSRWYFSGVTVIDDTRLDAFGPLSREARWEGLCFSQRARAAHTHDVWLPHLCGADVLAVDIEDGASLDPAPPPARVWIAYGDSITQGMNASQPVFTWVAQLARKLNANVINYGVGGATLRSELAAAVPDKDCELLTVSYGANDWNIDTPLAAFRANAAALLDALRRRHPQTPIVVTTPVPFFRATGPNRAGQTLDDFRAALTEVGRDRPRVCVVPGPELVPADHSYFNDWSHPNDAGMLAIAQNLQAALLARGIV